MAPNVKVVGISLPPELIDEVDTLATADGRNRSNWIMVALREIIDIRRSLAAGHRIVTLEESGAYDVPEGFAPDIDDPQDWDRSGVFYEDEDRPDGCVKLYKVAGEHRSLFSAMPQASVAWHDTP